MNQRCKGLALQSFLIMPIQRIPRYILFLEDLKKKTPESHPDSKELANAIEKTRKMADSMKYAFAFAVCAIDTLVQRRANKNPEHGSLEGDSLSNRWSP